MVCDIFVVPICTVTYKSYFNTGNKILIDKKMRLSEKAFETLVLMNDLYDV
jgi:hAT family C-terminal dimerisation region